MNYLNFGLRYIKNVLIIQIVWSLIAALCIKVGALEYLAGRCEDLQLGQYTCMRPVIDTESQSEIGCDGNTKLVSVNCMPAENITCKSSKYEGKEHTFNGTTVGFSRKISCRWTNGYSFETALLLSVYLGMFGIDRFYLGYPAIGLLKFSTLGFFFLGQLIDIILIAAQVVTPSDGSDYVIDYYGAKVFRISMNEETFIQPSDT